MKKPVLYILYILFLASCGETPFVANYEIKAEISTNNLSDEEESKMLEVLQKRFSAYQIRNEISFQGNEVTIKLMDKKRKIDAEGIKKLITSQGKFEFWHTYKNSETEKYFFKNADAIISEKLHPGFSDSLLEFIHNPEIKKEEWADFENNILNKIDPFSSVFNFKSREDIDFKEDGYSFLGEVDVVDTSYINKCLGDSNVRKSLPPGLEFLWGESPSSATRYGDFLVELYLIKDVSVLNNSHIAKAKNSSDLLKKYALVTLDFTEKGKKIWEEITKYSVENNSEIAFTLDRKVISSAIANQIITQGKTQITGGKFSKENGGASAYNLVVMLNNGVLPFSLTIIEFNKIKK